MEGSVRVPLLEHDLKAKTIFAPETVLEAVRAERGLPREPVPEICVLEFDGDLTDRLAAAKIAQPFTPWACFHTQMFTLDAEGRRCGMIARTIGGPYAVLVAEQLAASGAKVILGLTSAGRVSPSLPIPSLVIPTQAIRDEGTSYHYLPPAECVEGQPEVIQALQAEMPAAGVPVSAGRVWTTDAPYRETQAQLSRHASAGALAVEMQAASLLAFGAARKVSVGIVALVTNSEDHALAQFDKGGQALEFEVLKALCRAGERILRGQS